ncbi:hypothetical protein Q9189_006935, partial [Teloschistes chrysophthalmus]
VGQDDRELSTANQSFHQESDHIVPKFLMCLEKVKEHPLTRLIRDNSRAKDLEEVTDKDTPQQIKGFRKAVVDKRDAIKVLPEHCSNDRQLCG